jgi:hypothetical protein
MPSRARIAHDWGIVTKVEEAAGAPGAPSPLSSRGRLGRLRRRDGRAPLTVELAVIAWLFWLYDVINNLAPTRVAQARDNARDILSFEQSLHIDFERSLDRWLSAHAVLAFIATYWYFFAHVIVTFAVLAWLWWRRSDHYRQQRLQLVFINLIAFAVFWRYPLAPPRMLAGLGYRDVVASTHAVISWDSGALVRDADQLAAMPSLHVAWASWSALALFQLAGARRRIVRGLVVLYPLLTAVIVIATGNHWVTDVVAGALTFVCGVLLARLVAWAARTGRQRHLTPRELADAAPHAPHPHAPHPHAPHAIAPHSRSDPLAQTSSGPT